MRRVEIEVGESTNGRANFAVTIDGTEYAKGNCGTLARAAQQATHYAYMELSDPSAIGQQEAVGRPSKDVAPVPQTEGECPDCSREKPGYHLISNGSNSATYSPCPTCSGTGKEGEARLRRSRVWPANPVR